LRAIAATIEVIVDSNSSWRESRYSVSVR